MKAIVLVETCPGGGAAVVDALADDPSVVRAFATLGSGCVVQLDAADRAALLTSIERINAVAQQTGSETLLDMELGPPGRPVAPPAGRHRACLLVVESKDAGCSIAHGFSAAAAAIPGVEEAFPLLGRIDDVAWVRFGDMDDLRRIVAAVGALHGITGVEVRVEA